MLASEWIQLENQGVADDLGMWIPHSYVFIVILHGKRK